MSMVPRNIHAMSTETKCPSAGTSLGNKWYKCQNVYSTKMFLLKCLLPNMCRNKLKSTPNSFLPESLWMMMAVGISKNGLRSIWDARVLSLRYDKVHRLPKQCEELKEEGLDTQVTPIIEFLIFEGCNNRAWPIQPISFWNEPVSIKLSFCKMISFTPSITDGVHRNENFVEINPV